MNSIYTQKLSHFKSLLAPFLLVAFPGAYRFAAVFLCSFLLNEPDIEFFSASFLLSTFLVSFIGLPIAALVPDRNFNLSFAQKYLYVPVFLAFAVVAYYFTSPQKGGWFYFDVFLSALVLSIFEVQRATLVNVGRYENVFSTSLISVVLLFVAVVFFRTANFSSCFIVMLALLLPMLLGRSKTLSDNNSVTMGARKFVSKYRDYSLSGFFSTSTNSAIPLIIAYFSDANLVSDFAQIFAAASLGMLLPRALSLKMIPTLRERGVSMSLVSSYRNRVLFYVLGISVAIFPMMFFLYEHYLVLWLYFFAVQCSQLNLPYSNAFAVESKSSVLLKINAAGFAFVVFSSLFLLILDHLTPLSFVSVFCFSQFVKLYYSVIFCRKNFYHREF